MTSMTLTNLLSANHWILLRLASVPLVVPQEAFEAVHCSAFDHGNPDNGQQTAEQTLIT